MQNALSILGREALRIVLPAWCIVCERELPWKDRTASCCGECWASLPKITGGKCRSCALPLEGAAEVGGAPLTCINCSVNPLPLDWCDAWGHYQSGLEKILHAFKFQKHDFLDRPLAALIEDTLRERADLEFDAIAPIPMHRAKRRKRGYNQAELLAKALARSLRLRCEVSLLTKQVERETQSTLKRVARAANVCGTFRAGSGVAEKSILIVDDICTTGETLRAAAAELLDGGAKRVCAIAVAKAT